MLGNVSRAIVWARHAKNYQVRSAVFKPSEDDRGEGLSMVDCDTARLQENEASALADFFSWQLRLPPKARAGCCFLPKERLLQIGLSVNANEIEPRDEGERTWARFLEAHCLIRDEFESDLLPSEDKRDQLAQIATQFGRVLIPLE